MKKVLYTSLSSALVAGALLAASPAPTPAAAADSVAAPIDLGMVNTDRMIDSLVKQGVIPPGLTPEENEAKMREYLQKRVANQESRAADKSSRSANSMKLRSQAFGSVAGSSVAPAAPQAWDGSLRTDKILVLLVEYSDFAHNNIQPGETDMYYDNYTTEHYQNMLFNPNGYTGPDGKNHISMKQYYLQQSGGSYTVDGDVVGWLTVPQTAAYYGGNDPTSDSDQNPRQLVRDALASAAASGVDLGQYDQQDIYDLDGDGNFFEPDGLVDHLMILHSGVGEEAGGGSMGADAIWSHRWDLGSVYSIPGTTAAVPYWGGGMGAFDYTIEPEDGATGVFSHEYGHDLGLPDEYDTIYSGGGEPIEYWSIMSSGSWAGAIAGTEPSGFSPYAKEFFQNTIGGNWQLGQTVDFDSIPADGVTVTLDQASTHGTNQDVVRVNLPDKVHTMNTPATGSFEYWGGKGDEIDNTAVTNIDLTGATSATLDFDTWYRIESGWDMGFVQVSTDNGATWNSLSTANTSYDVVSDAYPTVLSNLPGYTGSSNGWLHQTVDLSAYAGQQIQLQFRYITDWGSNEEGFFVDNVKVTQDGATVLNDGAEGTSAFALNGFTQSEGKFSTEHYYLVEWRNHEGVDAGLAHIKRGNSLLSYDPGMVIWYVNGGFDNNWVGVHPGEGFLGVVDAHQNVHHWGGYSGAGTLAATRYQIFDATFGLKKGSDLDVYYGPDFHLQNAAKMPVPTFDDKNSFYTPSSVYSGLKLPSYGLKISVVGEASDRSAATIQITK
ncbi:MAG TPA: immune inhibitor A domain-containing protein [Bacilli bacterium]|nr:immune inhibitor A domain-containing protein [Bacilli bacterium]